MDTVIHNEIATGGWSKYVCTFSSAFMSMFNFLFIIDLSYFVLHDFVLISQFKNKDFNQSIKDAFCFI